jgi:type I restriction enzyme R subunit
VLDDTTFKTGNYKRSGGKQKLENIFEDDLSSILSQFYEHIWDKPA